MARARYSYVVHAPGGPFAFLQHPHIPGFWLRTHAAVLVAPCRLCHAVIGAPCTRRDGLATSVTHYPRREDAKGKLGDLTSTVTTIRRAKEKTP